MARPRTGPDPRSGHGLTAAAPVAIVLGLVAACTTRNPDYVPPAEGCSPGERSCAGSRPVECVPGGDAGGVLRNAPCPSAAGCSSGRCVPPLGAASCQREQDCAGGLTCIPLVAGSGLQGACIAPEGSLPGGTPCTAGSQCRTGLCVSTGSNAPKAVCYAACRETADCATGLRCRSYAVTVTGIQGNIQGCGPK